VLEKSDIIFQGAAAMKALVLALLFLFIAANEAKVYSKCELARILKRNGMDGYYGYALGNWICMAYYQSRYNSRFVGPRTSDGNREYGIFQISSRWWCNNYQGPTANGCNKPCSGLAGKSTAKEQICQNGPVVVDSEIDDPAFLFLLL
ncbi:hypothetical protein Chor_007039, partial [Crotalus horridus]